MPRLFALTLFVSATLLFMVQPMVGKMILPLLGGTPAAWNTCMVFFQSLLLLGYLYAHFATTRLDTRTQTRLHTVVLGSAVLWLLASAAISGNHSPIAVYRQLTLGSGGNPVFGVLMLLTLAVGLPFLVVSTSAPLLTRWFSVTNHPTSRDPYFLYAASNAGSLISLLGYPLFVEPTLTLAQQAWLWTGGYAVLFVLVRLCAAQANYPLPPLPPLPESATAVPLDDAPPSWPRRLHWLGLAFVPSSLMLGVTFHMTTDIGPQPLLWVIPLALYLLTFIIAFARTPRAFRMVLASVAAIAAQLLVFVIVTDALPGREKAFQAILLHLTVFFVLALMMHTELAHLRPAPSRSTEYFLWISIGGFCGGLFNALIAPAVFPAAYEYPITVALACFLIPAVNRPRTGRDRLTATALDYAYPAAIAAVTFYLVMRLQYTASFLGFVTGLAAKVNGVTGLSVGENAWRLFLVYAVPCMACFFAIDRPVRFGLCVAAVLAVGTRHDAVRQDDLWTDRSPFGILRVSTREDGGRTYHELLHGTTLHGMQDTESSVVDHFDALPLLGATPGWGPLATLGGMTAFDARQEPITYYHRTGPVQDLVRRVRELRPAGARLGMVGLGTGSMAAYLTPADRMTYYEIDELVVGLVNEARYFTYVEDARKRGSRVDIVLGDARLRLENTEEKYHLLLVDAFSSDAIPGHLLTREAMAVYERRLEPDGLLALHISNSFIDLRPVVARLAEDAGFVATIYEDFDNKVPGKTSSVWVVLARSNADLGPLAERPWRELGIDPAVDLWTDDYADMMRVMTVREIRWLRNRLGLPVAGQ